MMKPSFDVCPTSQPLLQKLSCSTHKECNDHPYARDRMHEGVLDHQFELEPSTQYFETPSSLVHFVCLHWNNVDALNKKWHELEEQRIDGHLNEVEQRALDAIEKQLLQFPNPYKASDHELAQQLITKYSRR